MVTALAICKILEVGNRAPAHWGALFAGQPILDRSKVKVFGGQNDPKFRRLALKEAVFEPVKARRFLVESLYRQIRFASRGEVDREAIG
jgi:hypothetical protein